MPRSTDPATALREARQFDEETAALRREAAEILRGSRWWRDERRRELLRRRRWYRPRTGP
jgi:hypothetical protein